ncbi:MAG: glucose-1-phosphate thymidylyltransferase, partial [Bacteroidetes bacterium]|nr:glucose-1-phosphate thymidylyltransferase [Bacteroidota bacterium]
MANYILNDIPENWTNLLPFTFTRPISDLRVGILTLKDKWELLLEEACSVITEEYLSEKYSCKLSDENVLINSVIIPTSAIVEQIKQLESGQILKNDNEWVAICTKDV